MQRIIFFLDVVFGTRFQDGNFFATWLEYVEVFYEATVITLFFSSLPFPHGRDADKRKQLVKAEKREDNTDKASTVSGETAKANNMVSKDNDPSINQNPHRRRVSQFCVLKNEMI